MKWRIDFSEQALKFLARNHLQEETIIEKLHFAIRKFSGEQINIDIKKLGGKWEGFYRIRVGKLRIIVEFNFEECGSYVEIVDWRGNAYK